MKESELEANLQKEFQKMNVSVQVLSHVYELVAEFVDTKMNYDNMIKRATLDSQRVEILLHRQETINHMIAYTLTYSDGMII